MVGGIPASNKVYVIDIASSAVVASITTGYGAHGVVITNDGQRAYVTNSLSNTVSVIDVVTQAVHSTIKVGEAPNGVSYRWATGAMP
jgi:YVTN family beta-propeller protein